MVCIWKYIPSVAFIVNFRSWGIKMSTMLTCTVTFFYTGTFAVIKKASWTPAARLTLHRVLRRRTYRSYGVTENNTHVNVFFTF